MKRREISRIKGEGFEENSEIKDEGFEKTAYEENGKNGLFEE